MQIVIDMPERTFESVKRYYEQNQDCYALCAYVATGTPLPKGHGRLIDADAPTIIEADKDDFGDYPDTIHNQFDNMTGSMNL